MSTPTKILPSVPRLRIFRELDVDALSEDFVTSITEAEGTLPYVDAARARDYPLTEEIMETTIGAILVDPEGTVLAKFDGPDGWSRAERAKASAKVTFDVDLGEADLEDEAPVKRSRRAAAEIA